MNRIYRPCGLIAFLIFAFLNAVNAFEAVSILEISRSKRTFRINLGDLEGVTEGEKGQFVLPSSEKVNSQRPKYALVAKAEVIKTDANTSIWYANEFFGASLLEKGLKLLVLRSSKSLKGRRALKIGPKKIVVRSNQKIVEEIFPEDLIKSEKKYTQGKSLKETTRPTDNEIDIIEVEAWKAKNLTNEFDLLLQEIDSGEGEAGKLTSFDYDKDFRPLKIDIPSYLNEGEVSDEELEDLDFATDLPEQIEAPQLERRAIQKGYSAREVQEALADMAFDNQARGQIKKANDAAFFPDLKPNELVKFRREYLESYRKKANRLGPTKVGREKMQRQGSRWSEDLSDEQLRRFIIDNGLAVEQQRQDFFLNNNVDHEVNFRGSLDLVDNSVPEDNTQNEAPVGYSIGYELHMIRLSRVLKNWSLEFLLAKEQNQYDLGSSDNINGFTEESSAGITVRYYMRQYHSTLLKFALFAGLGYRRGTAVATNPNIAGNFEYDFWASPIVELGFKYRYPKFKGPSGAFRWGWGLQGLVGYEIKRFRIQDPASAGQFFEEADFASLKMALGIGLYF